MALKSKRSRPWLSRLHLLVRLIGLTGLLAAVVGIVMAQVQGMLGSDEAPWEEAAADTGRLLLAAVQGQPEGDGLARSAVYVFLAGAAAAALWLLVEALVIVRVAAGRRSAFGANALAQVGIAAALLVGLNAYAFFHYLRIDCTRDASFTLPSQVQEQFRQLRPETTTTILVLIRPDRARTEDDPLYQHLSGAAEKVVVSKVRDVADQLRDFGPQFRVILLNTGEEDYPDKLKKVAKAHPGLEKAIKTAPPGNSIFFYARPDTAKGAEEGKDTKKDDEQSGEIAHIQRLSFDDFFQLDRVRSKKANGRRGNLVLLNKGVNPLARRILNLEEKRPRVGILIVDEAFSTESPAPDWTLAGLKKSLTQYGFEVRDVILKRNTRLTVIGEGSETGPRVRWQSDPAASLLDETRYRRYLNQQDRLPKIIEDIEKEIKEDQEQKSRWVKATSEDLKRLGVSEAFRRNEVESWDSEIESKQADLKRFRKRLEEAKEELGRFDEDDIDERLHMTDLRAKLELFTADCDLLLIARPSVWPIGFRDDLHHLEPFQLEAVRDFMRSGKPLLAFLGSQAEPPPRPRMPPPAPAGPDGLENLLAELHIKLGKQPILFNSQTAEDAEQEIGLQQSGRDVPSLDFRSKFASLSRFSALRRGQEGIIPAPQHENPIRESLVRTAEAAGGTLSFALRFPRPVYCTALPGTARGGVAGMGGKLAARQKYAPEFLWTDVACWNDDNPLTARRYIAPKKDDPARGTLDEKRRGPFPVGVAVEAEVPATWRVGSGRPADRVRVAVVGHGSPFSGTELSPVQEKVLLDTCNWLLRRGDLLTKETQQWSYPRLVIHDKEPSTGGEAAEKNADGPESHLTLSEREKNLWLWGARLGLPALFAWLGVIVLLVRRAQ